MESRLLIVSGTVAVAEAVDMPQFLRGNGWRRVHSPASIPPVQPCLTTQCSSGLNLVCPKNISIFDNTNKDENSQGVQLNSSYFSKSGTARQVTRARQRGPWKGR